MRAQIGIAGANSARIRIAAAQKLLHLLFKQQVSPNFQVELTIKPRHQAPNFRPFTQ